MKCVRCAPQCATNPPPPVLFTQACVALATVTKRGEDAETLRPRVIVSTLVVWSQALLAAEK